MRQYVDVSTDVEYGLTRGGSRFRNDFAHLTEYFPQPPLSSSGTFGSSSRGGGGKRRRRDDSSDSAAFESDGDGDGDDDERRTFEGKVQELVDFLNTTTGLKIFKRAYRENMRYKVYKYASLRERAEEEVHREKDVIDIRVADLKRAAKVEGESDNWNVFDSVSEAYREAKGRAASFEALESRARNMLEGTMSVDEVRSDDRIKQIRNDLVGALIGLLSFSSQSHVALKVVDIVGSFIKNPSLLRTKLINFMLLGGAGTGKTSLASAIGDVFAKAGIFVGNSLVVAGRADLVGQYEGQTVARTQRFLTNNLDVGVVFVDEAYAITPWSDGKPEGYGSEATTAMVDFMTKYPGLYCIIVAGYERQMVRYFLPSNEGLSRRFPNKYVLNDMTPSDLVRVFKVSLLQAQGLPLPVRREDPVASEEYFDDDAWEYLSRLVQRATKGSVDTVDEYDQATRRSYAHQRVFRPYHDLLYILFENQAGSMTNLADEAVTVLMESVTFEELASVQKKTHGEGRPLIRRRGEQVMRRVVEQSIVRSSFSLTPLVLAQLRRVEREMGY